MGSQDVMGYCSIGLDTCLRQVTRFLLQALYPATSDSPFLRPHEDCHRRPPLFSSYQLGLLESRFRQDTETV